MCVCVCALERKALMEITFNGLYAQLSNHYSVTLVFTKRTLIIRIIFTHNVHTTIFTHSYQQIINYIRRPVHAKSFMI